MRGGTPRSSLSRYIDAVERAGLRHVVTGDHVQAECPTHSDQHPSLSADYKPQLGQVMVTCHVGCDSNDVVAALELTWPMLYDDYEEPHVFAERRAREREEEARAGGGPARRRRQAPARPKGAAAPKPALPKGRLPARLTEVKPKPLGEWSVTATYPYTDHQGEVIHEEVRHQRPLEIVDPETGESSQRTEKRFTQRWPDGRGGWVEKTPAGFVPVLYRLPDLTEWIAEERRIWVCEGAKDAERLLALDEAATTNPSGASNFHPEQAEALAGAHVIVVLDQDLAGYRRGLKLEPLLRAKAASLRFVLPAVEQLHADATDHLDAGHELGDFVEVDVDRLVLLERTAEAESSAAAAAAAVDEAAARAARCPSRGQGSQRKGSSSTSDEKRYAARWAAEAGKHLVRAAAALEKALSAASERPEANLDLLQRCELAVDAAQVAALEAHEAAGVTVPEELAQYLQPSSAAAEARGRTTSDAAAAGGELAGEAGDPDQTAPATDEDPGEGPSAQRGAQRGAQIIDHPSSGALLPPPGERIPVSRRVVFAYEVGGGGRRRRGVYMGVGSSSWELIAPLPYVKARIIRRDGSGRQTGTFYLIAAEEDGPATLIGPDEIRSNSWTNILDLPISQDEQILRAASSALVLHAGAAPCLEATPRMSEDGKVDLPHPDTMPPGYLATSNLEREEALGVWREILGEAAKNPHMALVLGAAAIAPFIAGLKQQPHVVALYGGARLGKSTTLSAAGSLWGYPGGETDSGTCLSWNATTLSVPAFLGDLGVLPAFMDEIGQAGEMKDSQWHQLISNITQGAARMIRARNKPGVQLGLTWRGIFFSTGNAPMGHDAAGANSGVPRRLVELAAPFTNSEEHGRAIERLVPRAYGHVGQEILERHSIDSVRPLIARAATVLGGGFETPHETAMAEHLAAHLAGAMVLDEICGTGGQLTEAAVLAAAEFLDDCAPPPHDADRVLDELRDWIGREPGAWPTREQYLLLQQPKSPDFEHALPQHGFRPEYAGYIDDDGTVMVTHGAFKRIVETLEVSRKIVLPTLYDRGLLKVQESKRRRGEWAVQSRVFGGSVYAIRLPEPPEDDEEPDFSAGGGPVGGSEDPALGAVGGAVGGSDVPLTCDVEGVGGVWGNPSRVEARARRSHPADHQVDDEQLPEDPPADQADQAGESAGEQLEQLAQPVPCGVCGDPTGYALNGRPVHPGGPCAVVDQQPVDRSRDRGPRFSAPAACLDGEGIHLADGSTQPWPEVAHLGDLALLTGRDQLRLGWGGGEDRLPDQGQIWLYAAALERLGLPTTAPKLPDKALTKAQRAKATAKAFDRLTGHPVVAGAVEAGWQLGQGGRLGVWTRIWHSELLPQGALIVGLPWHRIEGVALFVDDPAPGELARRLALFAQQVGVAYRITAAATGLDLIDHHRPPRRNVDDDRGQGRGRVALVQRTAAELPPWHTKRHDARFAGLESDFSWWRSWEKLTDDERALPYVHGYDRNASYLVPWRGLELGVEGLIHRTGEQAAWDGKEHPGYYLVDDDWEWPSWGLPDPGTAAGARVGQGRMWVTVHTLRQLAAHGVTPTVHESYTWEITARYLEGPGTSLARARESLTQRAGEDAGARAVLSSVKTLYSSTVGKLAEREHHADYHLWRPDWRDHVIGATKTAILHTLTKALERSGASPLAVDRDAVFYTSSDPDPVTAWPGDPTKLGAGLGSWKPIGTAELATWGPAYLPARSGRWHYVDAVEALSGPGEVTTDD